MCVWYTADSVCVSLLVVQYYAFAYTYRPHIASCVPIYVAYAIRGGIRLVILCIIYYGSSSSASEMSPSRKIYIGIWPEMQAGHATSAIPQKSWPFCFLLIMHSWCTLVALPLTVTHNIQHIKIMFGCGSVWSTRPLQIVLGLWVSNNQSGVWKFHLDGTYYSWYFKCIIYRLNGTPHAARAGI